MRQILAIAVSVYIVSSVLLPSWAIDSYTVTESGTITLDTPSVYAQLTNTAAECVFDQTGDFASAENAHSFTGFAANPGRIR